MKWMKKTGALLAALLMTVALFAGCTQNNSPAGDTSSDQPSSGAPVSESASDVPSSEAAAEQKTVTIQVEQDGKVTLEKQYESDLATLEELMVEQAGELGATLTDSEYGKFVSGMNGYVADSAKNEYFEFLVDGETAQVGIGSTELADGAVYLFRLATY